MNSRIFIGLFCISLILGACTEDRSRTSVSVRPDEPMIFKSGADYGKAYGFPQEWWGKIAPNEKAEWEIGPDEALPGEVILSKRTELGILSNFASTPFILDGKGYASLEGFWQAMKYPDSEMPDDVRFKLSGWPMKREQVEKLTGFEAKNAGSLASKILEDANIDWVSYRGLGMIYREPGVSTFYQIIRRAMIEKLRQNHKVREILLQTKDLRLLADHKPGTKDQKAWKYHLIWEELRALAKAGKL